jgi:ABC-type amino acid transport substrate-binding protein
MPNTKKYIRYFGLASIIFMCLFSFKSSAAQEQLVFSRTLLGETFTCAHDALTSAYKKINKNISFLTLPNKRGLRMANTGDIDGEMLRIEGLELEHPNLIRIPVPICAVESVLIANERVTASKFEDFRKYRFGITIGFVDQENLVSKYQLNATKVIKNSILIDMLTRDRVDVIFLTKLDAAHMIDKSKKIKLKVLKGFNRKMFLYHYLHKKHRDLLPLITQALEELRDDGKIQLHNRVLRNVAPQ